MSKKVLVTYASKYGSTREVAEAIAYTLVKSGFETNLQHVKKVRDIKQFDFIVMGAPIYYGSLHKDISAFLTRNQETLTKLTRGGDRVRFFALGPTHNDKKDWKEIRVMLEKELAKFPWLSPIAIELFGGKYNPAKFNLIDKLITGLPASPSYGMPASDVRDWSVIRQWAGNLAENFNQVQKERIN